jgi:hypothetical protein
LGEGRGAHDFHCPEPIAMLEMTGLSAPAVFALTGAVLGWGLRPLFIHHRRAFFAAIAVIALVAVVYGANEDASAVGAPTPATHAR